VRARVRPLARVLFVVFALIGELTGVVAVRIGASRRYDSPMGKSDRAFVIGLLGCRGPTGGLGYVDFRRRHRSGRVDDPSPCPDCSR